MHQVLYPRIPLTFLLVKILRQETVISMDPLMMFESIKKFSRLKRLDLYT